MSKSGGDGGYDAPSSGYGKRYGYYYRSQNFRNKVLDRGNCNLIKIQTDDTCIKQTIHNSVVCNSSIFFLFKILSSHVAIYILA